MTVYRVKYNKRILKKFMSRQEAIEFCEARARSLIPARVSPSTFNDTSVLFVIEVLEDDKVISKEQYTAIVVMKK